jgi:predicted AAA+ superfamily ATPase
VKRQIDTELLTWKTDPCRKVLLLRGTRQVGKTWSLRKLGRTFENCVEINFEEDRDIGKLFQGRLDPKVICTKIGAYFSEHITPGETLLFFDEIQACPDALRSLRFFYEKMPELHVVAAGSLLEFALAEIPSFGVGRIQSLYLYTMSFREFLLAQEHDQLVELISSATPLGDVLHGRATELLRTYMIIGGFPEIVKTYVKMADITRCQKLLDDLLVTIRDDFSKYRGRAPSTQLDAVLSSIVDQAGAKFKYSNVDPHMKTEPVRRALELLLQAGLAHRIVHSDGQGIPIGAQINSKRFKVIPCDIGLYQRICRADIGAILTAETSEIINMGAAAEILAGNELIAYSKANQTARLFYWHRERKGSNAEVDYLIESGQDIIPIEVKSGSRGRMQSLRLFLETHRATLGIRVALEEASEYEDIKVVPLYALWNLI